MRGHGSAEYLLSAAHRVRSLGPDEDERSVTHVVYMYHLLLHNLRMLPAYLLLAVAVAQAQPLMTVRVAPLGFYFVALCGSVALSATWAWMTWGADAVILSCHEQRADRNVFDFIGVHPGSVSYSKALLPLLPLSVALWATVSVLRIINRSEKGHSFAVHCWKVLWRGEADATVAYTGAWELVFNATFGALAGWLSASLCTALGFSMQIAAGADSQETVENIAIASACLTVAVTVALAVTLKCASPLPCAGLSCLTGGPRSDWAILVVATVGYGSFAAELLAISSPRTSTTLSSVAQGGGAGLAALALAACVGFEIYLGHKRLHADPRSDSP